MQKILAPIRNPGVKISGLTRPAFPLRFCNPFLLAAIPSWRFNLGTIGTGCQRFQSQIDSDLLRSGTDFFFGNFADQIDVPAFAGVLTEAATFNRARKITAVPKAEGATGIAHGIVHDLDPGRLEGNPTRRPLPTPAQFAFLGLLATGRVLLTHCLHGLRMQAQFFTAARGQLAQIWIRRPALIPAQRVVLRFVAEIPNLITRPRQGREFGGATGIFDAVLEGFDHSGLWLGITANII